MKSVRVGIADDSVVVRRIMTDVFARADGFELVFVAKDGRAAVAAFEEHRPDVVVLDIEMPELDGIGALQGIRRLCPRTPVVMFSTLARRGAAATLEAMALGASDYVTKPSNLSGVRDTIQAMERDLLPRLAALVRRSPPGKLRVPAREQARVVQRGGSGFRIVAVGASTGGPMAVTTMLRQVPADFPLPIVLVQHMPPVFTTYFAEQLNCKLPLAVKEATHGDLLFAGGVWIAPGGYHMVVVKRGDSLAVLLNEEPPVHFCRPAVDVLFKSVASTCGRDSLAVVLTGMGQDGLAGAKSIHELGGVVAVQDEQSAVVWGMPGCVSRAGLAGFAGDPEALGRHVATMATSPSHRASG